MDWVRAQERNSNYGPGGGGAGGGGTELRGNSNNNKNNNNNNNNPRRFVVGASRVAQFWTSAESDVVVALLARESGASVSLASILLSRALVLVRCTHARWWATGAVFVVARSDVFAPRAFRGVRVAQPPSAGARVSGSTTRCAGARLRPPPLSPALVRRPACLPTTPRHATPRHTPPRHNRTPPHRTAPAGFPTPGLFAAEVTCSVPERVQAVREALLRSARQPPVFINMPLAGWCAARHDDPFHALAGDYM